MSSTPVDLIYQSAKTYQHSAGFSCCFRQWKAESHCNKLHGYALKVEVVFEGTLDYRNWVVDFGSLNRFKQWLVDTFDHKVLIAKDDPNRQEITVFNGQTGLMDIVIVDAVGCEKFAEMIFTWLDVNMTEPNAKVQSVQVWEHEGNSAKVIRKPRSSVHSDSDVDLMPIAEELRNGRYT